MVLGGHPPGRVGRRRNNSKEGPPRGGLRLFAGYCRPVAPPRRPPSDPTPGRRPASRQAATGASAGGGTGRRPPRPGGASTARGDGPRRPATGGRVGRTASGRQRPSDAAPAPRADDGGPDREARRSPASGAGDRTGASPRRPAAGPARRPPRPVDGETRPKGATAGAGRRTSRATDK